MRLFLLTALTMLAFAANSVFNKIGVSVGGMNPLDFAILRLWSGAAMLLVLVALRPDLGSDLGTNMRPNMRTGLRSRLSQIQGSVIGTTSLLVYMLGFSLAYASLDTGTGALILFGVVQITMFAAALRAGDPIPSTRYVGCGVAFAGLAFLLWPAGNTAPDVVGAGLMAAAGVGWGIYTLIGRGASAPLRRTAGNFTYAALAMVLVAFLVGLPQGDALGYLMAVLSGAVSSALGYALWYKVLPMLETTTAATAQLTVPIIAFIGGLAFLGEPFTWRFALSCMLVLGGVALALRRA